MYNIRFRRCVNPQQSVCAGGIGMDTQSIGADSEQRPTAKTLNILSSPNDRRIFYLRRSRGNRVRLMLSVYERIL